MTEWVTVTARRRQLRARRNDGEPCDVQTADGPKRCYPGDWIIWDEATDRRDVCPGPQFAARYVRVF